MAQFSLSVFFPAFNEEANIENTVKQAAEVLGEITKNWEILVINDGSTDRTGEVAKQLGRKDARIKVISHKFNKGYGEALKTGFKAAKYPWVAYADSDGQFDFSEIKNFLQERGNADFPNAEFILGYRIKRADPLIRRIGTFFWNLLAKILIGLSVRDYSCGFKLIKKAAFQKLLPLEAGEKVTQIEMIVRAKKMGFKFAEVGVKHYPRRFGQQTGANVRVVLKSYFDLLGLWWSFVDRREFFTILAILALGSLLKFYKLPEYMTFLGDEGRDVIVVRRLLVNFDPILVGPGTSIGNMYLGPLYYYMMAPALFLFKLSPVGPAAQIALLGVITIWFVWWIGKEWFGKIAGMVAAALYAVSPVVINYSHSSWNPNIMPFFALLSIYSIWRVWKHNEWKWLLVLGVAYAFVLQSHYLGLLLLPTVGLFWLLAIKGVWRQVEQRKRSILHTLYSILIFLFLMSPLVIFDARHNWRNFQAIYTFFSARQETVSLRPWNAIPDMWPIWQEKFITRFIGGMSETVGVVLALLLLVGALWLLIINRRAFFTSPPFLLFTWLLVGMGGLGLYKQNIYDHYFGFMFAAPFLLTGAVMQEVSKVSKVPQVSKVFLLGGITLLLVVINLAVTPIKSSPQKQFQRTEEVARKIIEEANGEPLNLAVLAERNYEDAYQYFLEWWRYPVRDIDPLRYEETVAEQLFVVCEFTPDKCDPTHSPKAEVTVFGWSKIDGEWDVAGVKLYKLGHNPSGKPQ